MPREHLKCWHVIGLLLLAGAAHAQSGREQLLAEMDHKTWTARDGAPQGIKVLAQAADGTLWIGSDSGLFNFDGRTFTPFQSPAGEPELPLDVVTSLCVARDGSLWVGFEDAGVAHIAQGHVTLYLMIGDHRLRWVFDLREASDGSIWGASTQNSIVRFGMDRKWHLEPMPLENPARIFAFLDSADILWVSQRGRLHRRDIRESRYTETNVAADWMFGFSEAPDGTFWIHTFDGAAAEAQLQHVDRHGRLIRKLIIDTVATDILYRPDGSLMLTSSVDGVRLLSRDELTGAKQSGKDLHGEAFTRRQGLTSDQTSALLRDRDGNLWVGSTTGLDRFSRGSFIPFDTGEKTGFWSVCANEQGEVSVGCARSNAASLYRISSGKTREFPLGDGGVSNLFCGRDGQTWVVRAHGAWTVRGDQMTAVPQIPGLPAYSVVGVVVNSDQTLFASVGIIGRPGDAGIWQYKQGRWSKFASPVIASKSVRVLYLDRQERLWVGLRDEVALPTSSGGEIFSAPGMGLAIALLETQRGFFAAGAGGLAVQRGPRFELLAFEDRGLTSGLSGVVEARDGDLWLNASRGIVRVPANELQAALGAPDHRIKAELVTEGDFAGFKLRYSGATAARDADGRLWFVTRSNGVFHVDPAHRTSDIHPPIVSIRSIEADRIPLGADKTIAPRPQTVEMRYFGVHLTDPNRVTYRYRLTGFEDAWQEAGHRTEAFYTRLGPGTYTFQVMASSGNDVWTAPVSSEPFVVLPSFYQTAWFRLSIIIAALALIFAAFTLRVRALTRAIRARAEERADERIRIARELHDTLLQGIQGLLLNFHVAAQKIAPDDASKAMLERTLSTADRIIVEGRNRVSSLRSEQLTDSELVASVENAGKDLRSSSEVEFSVKRTGSDVTLHPHVADEIFWIAREALTNAFRHAGPSRISIELNYGTRYFSMRCEDDGRGFDTNSAEKQGHWGLRGMTERARRIGGQLRVHSAPARGAEIVASVPSYRAYMNHSRLMFYLCTLRIERASSAQTSGTEN